jgi:hypothetical protein
MNRRAFLQMALLTPVIAVLSRPGQAAQIMLPAALPLPVGYPQAWFLTPEQRQALAGHPSAVRLKGFRRLSFSERILEAFYDTSK